MHVPVRGGLESARGRAVIAGRYRVEGALGTGGTARVYRVTDATSGKQLALKRLAPTASRKVATLFELEYQTLATIQHPAVVQVFDYGRDQDGAFYTLELLEGEDLKERAPVPFREACGYLRAAAQALELLHARRLVHRDVSPRNLWRTPDGRVKLIDFGAVAPFGRSAQVLGTPPFMAPEALYGNELDERTDLFSLGAVAYYLLTRRHAFPARGIGELPQRWRAAPPPPSQAVAALARSDLEPIPAELDALVLGLLSPNRLARPSSGAEVIDRIDALLGVAAAPQPMSRELSRAHLSSAAYAGQTRARRTLRRLFLLADQARGQSCVIDGEPGSGLSRLLRELSLEAQVADVTVLHARAGDTHRMFGTAAALGVQLLRSLPGNAMHAARPHLAWLSHASPELRTELAQQGSQPSDLGNELRVRIQRALRDWFLTVAADHTLVVLVDDLDQLDPGSFAFLVSLAAECKRGRLLLASTVRAGQARSLSERALREISHPVHLPPLGLGDSLALLRSVFGSAENLERLAVRLHRASQGNPGRLLELCEQLLVRDVIGYAEGTWLLPAELPEQLAAESREQALLTRLALLDAPARELGRVLSVHIDALPLELAGALAEGAAQTSLSALRALCDAGVCASEGETLRFTHPVLRRALEAELTTDRRKRAQRIIGEFVLSNAERALERLRAGVALLESDDPRGAALVSRACLHIALHESDEINAAARFAEGALVLFRAGGAPPREQAVLLALLAIAGYSGDRRYAEAYGADAVEVLQELVGLRLAGRLRAYLGRKLGLLVGLLVAGIRLGRQRRGASGVTLQDALTLLFNAVAALAGTSTICYDPDRAHRYAEALEPFSALGTGHVAAYMHAYCVALGETTRDMQASMRLRWQSLIARLEDARRPLRGLSETIRRRFLQGALAPLGVLEAQREGEAPLGIADSMDAMGLALASMSAAQIRAVYYASQGNLALFERHRALAERASIEQGTSWQVEIWAPIAKIFIAFRTHDAMGLKLVGEQLQRLAQDIPSLARLARQARGAYLLRRERYVEALAWVERDLEGPPRAYAGWTRAHAMIAHAHNQLGEHASALAVCLRASAQLTADDEAFGGAALLSLQTARLVAEAGCGDGEGAAQRLRELLDLHRDSASPLTRGELHDAGMTIALMTDRPAEAHAHFTEMERCYLETGVPSLAQYCERRRRRIESGRTQACEDADPVSSRSASTGDSADAVDLMLAGGPLSLVVRAERALEIVLGHVGATCGMLSLLSAAGDLRRVAARGAQVLGPEAELWLRESIGRELVDEDTQMVTGEGVEAPDGVLTHGRFQCRVLVLVTAGRVIGGVVVAAEEALPGTCPANVLETIAHHLSRDHPVHGDRNESDDSSPAA